MRVEVDLPQVRGPWVRFSWRQDAPNPRQRRNHWSIIYPGVPLWRVSTELLVEVFLAMQLPAFLGAAGPVDVQLPLPMPQPVLDWWRNYHAAERVRLGPASSANGYRPLRPARGSGLRMTEGARRERVAITFGGGKDSTLAAEAVIGDVGVQNVLLLHGINPFTLRRSALPSGALRSRRTILAPYRRRGVRTATMLTDYLGNLTRDRTARPGVALYLTAGLPALLHHACTEVTVSHTAGGYVVRHRPDGSLRWMNAQHRPESLDALGTYYADVLDVDLRPSSTHFPISEFVSFATLRDQYPRAFGQMVMCMRATKASQRWCLDCKKCAEYALFGLALDHVDPDFDYDTFLSGSAYVAGLVRHVQQSRQDGVRGNVPWAPAVGTRTHIAALYHAVHLLDPALVADRLGPESARALEIVRDGFGQQAYPAVDVVPEAAARRATSRPARAVLAAAEGRGTPVMAEMPGGLLDGDEPADMRYDEMPVSVPAR